MKTIEEIEDDLKIRFKQIDEIAEFNTKKVLDAYRKHRISTTHFAGTTGYAYTDKGKEGLCKVYSEVFGGEDAIVSPLLMSGTHTISVALLGLLRPKDVMLSISGTLYDTLQGTLFGCNNGSLQDLGIKYEQVDLCDGKLDEKLILKKVKKLKPKVIYLQKSRGYSLRPAISCEEMRRIFPKIKQILKDCYIMVDNCYGEFTEKVEPLEVGADVIMGSLIKNAGGGLAQTGGYIVGTKKAIDLIACRYCCPSLGKEVGSYEHGYRSFYQGFFMAPHTVKEALKCAYLVGAVMEEKGYKVSPATQENSYDIVKTIAFDSKEQLISFVQKIQYFSPIDSFVTPQPWDMAGYDCKVIMAAGTFVEGASIELSCDAPIKKPFTAFFQGGLVYEQGKIIARELINE